MFPPVEILLQDVCDLLQNGKTIHAVVLLEHLIAHHPRNAPGLQMLGMVHAMQGDMHAAVRVLRQASVISPDNGALRLHLARAEWETGLPAQAAASFEQAIATGCTVPDIRIDYAVALQALKQFPAALLQCDAALAQDPLHARAWRTRANLLHQQNRMEEALDCHARAIALSPDAAAWSARAATLDAIGRLDEALACHDRALECDPVSAAVWTHRGATLAKMRRHAQALDCHLHATGLDPSLACAWGNMGATLCRLDRNGEALAAHDRAVSLQAGFAALWLQRGATLMAMERSAEALASFNAAVRLAPDSAHAWYHRAVVLCAEHRLDEALDSLEEAITLDADHALASILLSEVLRLQDRDAESMARLEQALATAPGHHLLRFTVGLNQLANGNFADGWRNYQSYRCLDACEAPRHTWLTTWSGAEPLQGKRLLVYAEQGNGDVIQSCRYLPRVAALGCALVFEVQPELKRLLSTLDRCQVAARGEALPACDYVIPLMALPLALGASLQDIPRRTPYLYSRRRPKEYERTSGTVLRVGIACSGNPALHTNTLRSAPLACFETLQAHCALFLLQNAVHGADAAYLAGNPAIRHPCAGFIDFADTADLIATMDLVISVDTSIAHLAGALGKPVWILLPRLADWRWFRASGDSPWYPGARLFRQQREGDWSSVFRSVEAELRRLSLQSGCLRQGAA